MRAVFNRPNSFTQRSVLYNVVSNYEVQLSFKQNVGKGNDPARYLYPVAKTGGAGKKPAYETKFTRYIHKAGIAPNNRWPVPVKENLNKNSTEGLSGRVLQGLARAADHEGAGKTSGGIATSRCPTIAIGQHHG